METIPTYAFGFPVQYLRLGDLQLHLFERPESEAPRSTTSASTSTTSRGRSSARKARDPRAPLVLRGHVRAARRERADVPPRPGREPDRDRLAGRDDARPLGLPRIKRLGTRCRRRAMRCEATLYLEKSTCEAAAVRVPRAGHHRGGAATAGARERHVRARRRPEPCPADEVPSREAERAGRPERRRRPRRAGGARWRAPRRRARAPAARARGRARRRRAGPCCARLRASSATRRHVAAAPWAARSPSRRRGPS